jgi:hypothetical protein
LDDYGSGRCGLRARRIADARRRSSQQLQQTGLILRIETKREWEATNAGFHYSLVADDWKTNSELIIHIGPTTEVIARLLSIGEF